MSSGFFSWRVKIDFIDAPFLPKSKVNEAIRLAFHKVGVYWHDEFRPRHFTGQAFGLYGYKPRKRKYWFAKLKKTGQALPLVRSGRSRELSGLATITATTSHVKVAMPANALNFRHPKSQINMAEELRTIAPSEHQELETIMGRALRDALRSHRHKVRVVIGG